MAAAFYEVISEYEIVHKGFYTPIKGKVVIDLDKNDEKIYRAISSHYYRPNAKSSELLKPTFKSKNPHVVQQKLQEYLKGFNPEFEIEVNIMY